MVVPGSTVVEGDADIEQFKEKAINQGVWVLKIIQFGIIFGVML